MAFYFKRNIQPLATAKIKANLFDGIIIRLFKNIFTRKSFTNFSLPFRKSIIFSEKEKIYTLARY